VQTIGDYKKVFMNINVMNTTYYHAAMFEGGIVLHCKEFIKRRLILITTLSLMLLLCGTIKYSFPVMAEGENSKIEKIILIDPGHGGYDGGADGINGLKEKDINLNICLKLRDTLISKGYKVVMTREEDNALLDEGKRTTTKKAQDIANRCKVKELSNADAFISIHQNHFPQGKYYGSQVWYSRNEESRALAHIVQENLKIDLNNGNKRIEKPAKNDYRILVCTDIMPSILIECGFLSNSEEANLLNDEGYQQKIADSIRKSIDAYFEED
jgi:N-acetylmuramoyl-L-alanine amidase